MNTAEKGKRPSVIAKPEGDAPKRRLRSDAFQPTPEALELLLERFRKGQSMRSICDTKGMPDRRTLQKLMSRDDEVSTAITRAREVGYVCRGEAAIDEARACTDAQKGRLILDAEKWFLGKMSKALSDKTVIAGDRDNPIQVSTKVDLTGAPQEVIRYLANLAIANEAQ